MNMYELIKQVEHLERLREEHLRKIQILEDQIRLLKQEEKKEPKRGYEFL